MSFEEKDLTGDVSGLGAFELEALQDWEYKFMSKYVKVGTVKTKEVPVTNGSEPSGSAEAVEATDKEAAKQTEDSPSENPAAVTEDTSATEAEKKDE